MLTLLSVVYPECFISSNESLQVFFATNTSFLYLSWWKKVISTHLIKREKLTSRPKSIAGVFDFSFKNCKSGFQTSSVGGYEKSAAWISKWEWRMMASSKQTFTNESLVQVYSSSSALLRHWIISTNVFRSFLNLSSYIVKNIVTPVGQEQTIQKALLLFTIKAIQVTFPVLTDNKRQLFRFQRSKE